MALVMDATRSDRSPSEILDLINELNQFIEHVKDYWLATEFDVVIAPAGALPALPHKTSSELFCVNSYFMLYNILDYPCGVVPIKIVQSEDIKVAKNIKSSGGGNSDRVSEFMRIA